MAVGCTFQTIKQAAKQLPQYLGKADAGLAQEFITQLDSFTTSHKASDHAAQNLCTLFENERELDLILQKSDNDFAEGEKNFFLCAARVRKALIRAEHLEVFLNDLKSPSSRKKKSDASKSRKPNGSPKFSYACIRQYKEVPQKELLDSWANQDLVDDKEDYVNLDEVIRRGLLEECLHTTDGVISYQEFYRKKIEPMQDTVIALRGELGVGKSLLTQYVACKIISKKEDNIIIPIGQRSAAASKDGKTLLQAFKQKLFRRERKITGKFYIIIDEPDADQLRWNEAEWKKLYAAAQYYTAKIILVIRDGSNDEKLLKYFSVKSSNIIHLQEAPKAVPMPEGWEKWIDEKKIPYELLEKFRQLPLFRLLIDNRLWRLLNQKFCSTDMLKDCFLNTYTLIDYLYVNRLRDKEAHTGSNTKNTGDKDFYGQCDEFFQYIAFKLCENGGPVSWTEGIPDQRSGWETLIKDGFVENILNINFRRGQQSQSVISGFRHTPLYHYFLTWEFRNRLVGGEGLDQAIPLLIKELERPDHNILADGLRELPNDMKNKAIQNLEHSKKTNRQFSKAPYNKVLKSLIDLLSC